MRSELFRTHMFGGYRKDDVDAYIEKLESEIIRLETQAKSGPDVQSKSVPSRQPEFEDFIVLGGEEDVVPVESVEEPAIPVREQAEQPVNAEVERLKRELEEERLKGDQSARMLQVAIYEKQRLSDELEALKKEQQGFIGDRDAIKEVLMNARVNAEVIMTKARREARLLLEDAQRQIVEQKRETMTQLMGQLSENYSGLRASKYLLEEQLKSIETMERQIAEIRNRVQDGFEAPVG